MNERFGSANHNSWCHVVRKENQQMVIGLLVSTVCARNTSVRKTRLEDWLLFNDF